MSTGGDRYFKIQNRILKLSHLDKVFYPKTGFTKKDIMSYYQKIAPVLLPHLANRALTLKRYPNGVEDKFFYEKRCPSHRPPWLKTSRTQAIPFCLGDDLPSLIWIANLGSLELHTSLAASSEPTRPQFMVFDLDPGPGAGMEECCEVALLLKDKLKRLGLQAFPKTSGSKGMQVYVPLHTTVSFDQTKYFSHQIALYLESKNPDLIVSKMLKILRTGKVLIDWSQNSEHKTTVCAYSLRACDAPTVSTPLQWKELKKPDRLSFEASDVLKRVEKYGDLFAPVLTLNQTLPPATWIFADRKVIKSAA